LKPIDIADDISTLDYSFFQNKKSKNPHYLGSKLYQIKNLKKYDIVVLGVTGKLISNSNVKPLVLSLYRKHLSSNHLDIGPGSGYFLDKSTFPSNIPKLTLSDIHPDCLVYCVKRLARYNPLFFQTNIMTPFKVPTTFDSIGMNWVLHCMPGNLDEKLSSVCKNIVPMLNSNGAFFGSTILGTGGDFSFFGKILNYTYNSMGIFSNLDDDVESLKKVLSKYFETVTISMHGSLALFSGVGR
jgi:hypothetical protein